MQSFDIVHSCLKCTFIVYILSIRFCVFSGDVFFVLIQSSIIYTVK